MLLCAGDGANLTKGHPNQLVHQVHAHSALSNTIHGGPPVCARDTPSRMLTMPPRHAPLASSNSTNSTSALFFHLRSTRVVIYNIYSILYVHVQLVRAQRRIECALDTHSNSLTGPTAYPAIDWIVVFYTATSSSASSWG